VQDSSTPRPLLTNVGLSKGGTRCEGSQISSLGTNHHRQKQQQSYNELQIEGGSWGVGEGLLAGHGTLQRSQVSEMFTDPQPVSSGMYSTIDFCTVSLGREAFAAWLRNP
jgi:hypothetical protein